MCAEGGNGPLWNGAALLPVGKEADTVKGSRAGFPLYSISFLEDAGKDAPLPEPGFRRSRRKPPRGSATFKRGRTRGRA